MPYDVHAKLKDSAFSVVVETAAEAEVVVNSTF
jgi:hypothetical protein